MIQHPQREEIARIVNPAAFGYNANPDSLAFRAIREDAFKKADAILALAPAPIEGIDGWVMVPTRDALAVWFKDMRIGGNQAMPDVVMPLDEQRADKMLAAFVRPGAAPPPPTVKGGRDEEGSSQGSQNDLCADAGSLPALAPISVARAAEIKEIAAYHARLAINDEDEALRFDQEAKDWAEHDDPMKRPRERNSRMCAESCRRDAEKHRAWSEALLSNLSLAPPTTPDTGAREEGEGR